jgi:O-antigen/teichoic acid export membrane protein
MKYFIIFTLLAFLAVMGYLDVLKYLLRNRDYWEGLKVVPIVMCAEIMMGVYFNLSFWYKLIDKTIWGAVFSGAGCAVLLAVNFIFVPKISYMACAWAGVAGYGTAMLLSYFVGQKFYKIDYPLKDIGLYTLLAAILYVGIFFVGKSSLPLGARLAVNTVIILLYMAYIVKKDLPLSGLPVIGKYFRKG